MSMKKLSDKLFHHHHNDSEIVEISEDREHELERSKDGRHVQKETHVKFDEPHVISSSTTTTTTDLHKKHNFGDTVAEKVHHVVDKAVPHHTHASHEHGHEHEHEHGHEHVHEHINAPIVDTVVRATIVEETVRRDRVVEIQPIIHRHIDAPEVHHVEKHLYEKVAPLGPARVVKQAVIEETIQPHITEDITTVLHREVPAPYIVHEEQHITQHQVQPVVHTKEVIKEKEVIVGSTNVLKEEIHTSDWEQQTVDRCPLALKEHHLGGVEKTTSTTTTTTNTLAGENQSLTDSFDKVSLTKETPILNQQGVATSTSTVTSL